MFLLLPFENQEIGIGVVGQEAVVYVIHMGGIVKQKRRSKRGDEIHILQNVPRHRHVKFIARQCATYSLNVLLQQLIEDKCGRVVLRRV